MELKDLLHKRVLLASKSSGYSSKGDEVEEVKVLEISPSGTWVKLQNMNGNKYWKHYSNIQPIEVLESLIADKPKNQ